MTCSIDQREKFQIIAPKGDELNEEVKEEIIGLVHDCIQNANSSILDLGQVDRCTLLSIDFIQTLHYEMYSNHFSFVVTQASESLKLLLSPLIQDENINYTPTLAEAIDIVAMEDIERELLDGEI